MLSGPQVGKNTREGRLSRALGQESPHVCAHPSCFEVHQARVVQHALGVQKCTPRACNFTCFGRATPCTPQSDWACKGRDLHNYQICICSNKYKALNATRRGYKEILKGCFPLMSVILTLSPGRDGGVRVSGACQRALWRLGGSAAGRGAAPQLWTAHPRAHPQNIPIRASKGMTCPNLREIGSGRGRGFSLVVFPTPLLLV